MFPLSIVCLHCNFNVYLHNDENPKPMHIFRGSFSLDSGTFVKIETDRLQML